MLLILVQNAANAFKAATIPKLYIPSIINTEQIFGQIKNGLVSGRLACTSSNPKNLRSIKFSFSEMKSLRNRPNGFDIYLVNVKTIRDDCANFYGLLRKAELY